VPVGIHYALGVWIIGSVNQGVQIYSSKLTVSMNVTVIAGGQSAGCKPDRRIHAVGKFCATGSIHHPYPEAFMFSAGFYQPAEIQMTHVKIGFVLKTLACDSDTRTLLQKLNQRASLLGKKMISGKN